MPDTARTWHHGLVARWWAEFDPGDDNDARYFARLLGASGEPVLDAGCGAGRVLLPLVRAGIDVDGSDVSQDMLDACARRLADEGLQANLYQQPMHELSLPRQYRTIFVCGAFGVGTTRAHDQQGLHRIREHLVPGGCLIMDYYLPNLEHPKAWMDWAQQPQLPKPWSRRVERRRAGDGTELALKTRMLDLDPLEQTAVLEIEVAQFDGARQVNAETHSIDLVLYLKKEIELMLQVAGFDDVSVTAFNEDRPPEPWRDQRIVFHARVAES